MNQLAFNLAVDRKQAGMQQAADHANAVEPEWTGQALGMLTAFAAEVGRPFLIEEARAWAEQHGLPKPPDARSWGAVTKSASVKGRILKVGYGPASSSNLSPKVKWEKAA